MGKLEQKVRLLRVYNDSLLDDDDELADAEGSRGEAVEVERPPEAQVSIESIVMRRRRPVLAIREGAVVLEFRDIDDIALWKTRLQQARAVLAPAIAAVGRVDLTGNPDFSWVGTGWLVHPRYVVTNRHVAEEFARKDGEGFAFQAGLDGAMGASIDYLQEIGSDEKRVFKVERIAYIEARPGLDLAFLEVEQRSGAPTPPIALSGRKPEKTPLVATIGYPAFDSRIPEPDLMREIYGNVYDKKRLAPGAITEVDEQRLFHNCTTLGGNSGSVVLDLTTGEALGLHFSGSFLRTNFAVRADLVKQRLAALLAGTLRASREATRPSPPSRRAAARPASFPASQAGKAAADGVTGAQVDPSAAPNQVSFVVPLHVAVSVGPPAAGTPTPRNLESQSKTPGGGDRRTPGPAGDLRALAKAISWDPETFSRSLSEAMSVHDYGRAEGLLQVFSGRRCGRTRPYPPIYARCDLATLRRKRQFTLMCRYARAVLAAGGDDPQVRRQYGQALIELGQFDSARKVLEAVVRDGGSRSEEAIEARGLLGRSHKQQYADAPKGEAAAGHLKQAISAYEGVYEEDEGRLWHGINAVSCRLRAAREGMNWADADRARRTAHAIRDLIEKRSESPPALPVWDLATRVEALIATEEYERADSALDQYLRHPALDAFEVSSTYRQFVEILQLEQDPRGKRIAGKLWDSVERLRVGSALRRLESTDGPRARIPIVVRVTNPAWAPTDIPDLTIHGRLGTIIAAEGSREAITQLLRNPSVTSIEESRATGTNECTVSLPFINAMGSYSGPAGTYSEEGEGALIAFIDDGIDVLHAAFLDAAGRSRIVGIWDQKNPKGPAPTGLSTGPSFGTYHSQADVERYVSQGAAPSTLNRNTDGHGTHVASIAAGRRVGAFGGGVAPSAKLLVVIADSRGPIGYSRAHIAALDFIDREATKLGLPVVVNVSQGMNAGAHDGKSALEVGFDEFAGGGRKPGRLVVKSAGNEREKKGHAVVVLAQNAIDVLTWQRPQDATWPREKIELWWNSANEADFRLCAPSGAWSAAVGESNPTVKGNLAGTAFQMDFVKRHVDNGDSQLRIEIGDGGGQIPPGLWKLEIASRSVPEEGSVHAWIERGAGTPSSFVAYADQNMTLSIPGTAMSVITVGAVWSQVGSPLGNFSSFGPTRDKREKPEVAAPGLEVKAARGGSRDAVIPMDGTSMAAPHVAGAIALVLSKRAKAGREIPAANQLASALRQKTKDYNSRWEPGRGFGVIDVAKLLAAF